MAQVAKRLKIGLVLDTSLDPNDGVQQYVLAIGAWLSTNGHDVHYLVGETKQRDLANLHSLARNMAVVFNGNRTTIPLPTSRRKLKNFMHDQNFDVLHVQVPHSPFMAHRLILAAAPQTAVIGTFHILPYGWAARWGNRLLGIWLRGSLRRFDQMLAVSTAAAAFARQSFRLEAAVLPNVIDYKRFRAAKPLPQYQDDRLNLLFLGRLVRRKGCQLLLTAVSQLKETSASLPPFRVIICGKGPLESKLKQYTIEHDLGDVVEFVGYVSEAAKPRYYASADLAVFPSNSGESFGIVLLEAMASGRAAVLAGDNPGYHSVMAPQPPLLFKPTSEELAKRLQIYLSDHAERELKAKWGSQYAAEFDVSIVGPKLLMIYNQALRKRRQL